MKEVLEGSHAVSEAVRLAKVQVIAAYPITPQTHIVEALSEFCENGTMDAGTLEDIYWMTKNSAAPENESVWVGLA